MLYQRKSFTLPTGGRNKTEEEWEIIMGMRCYDCKKPITEQPDGCRCNSERIGRES